MKIGMAQRLLDYKKVYLQSRVWLSQLMQEMFSENATCYNKSIVGSPQNVVIAFFVGWFQASTKGLYFIVEVDLHPRDIKQS